MGLKENLHNLKEKYKGTKMAPAFNAIHTFLYLPNDTTHNGTHIKAADDLKRNGGYVPGIRPGRPIPERALDVMRPERQEAGPGPPVAGSADAHCQLLDRRSGNPSGMGFDRHPCWHSCYGCFGSFPLGIRIHCH